MPVARRHAGSRIRVKAGLLGTALAACFFCSTIPSHAEKWVTIAAENPIRNEIGELLPGTYHSPPEERALVHILRADNGIFPPMPDGSPHPENPILEDGITGIGNRTSPIIYEDTGYFEVLITNNIPEDGTLLFVRAYHKPTTEESLFYGDSQIITIEYEDDMLSLYEFFADIPATDQIVDSERDTDNDGLPDWWEWLYFRNITNAVPDEDYDGSGMTNWQEYKAGTNPTDSRSFLGITHVEVQDNGDVRVEWLSVPGRRYRVRFRDSGLTEQGGFRDVTKDITAEDALTAAIIPESEVMNVQRGYFRVRVFPAE